MRALWCVRTVRTTSENLLAGARWRRRRSARLLRNYGVVAPLRQVPKRRRRCILRLQPRLGLALRLTRRRSSLAAGGDAPGPALNAPPAPSATSMCRLSPTWSPPSSTARHAGRRARAKLPVIGKRPDVVLLQHMLSRNTSTPPDSHTATPSSSDPPTPVRGRSEDALARLTTGEATPKRNESLRRRMAKSMAVETKQGLAHVKQCGATHCTGYDGVHGVEDITLTSPAAPTPPPPSASRSTPTAGWSPSPRARRPSRASSAPVISSSRATARRVDDEVPPRRIPKRRSGRRSRARRSRCGPQRHRRAATCACARLCQSNGSLVLRHRQREASQLAAAQALAGEFDLAEIGRAELAAGDREAPTPDAAARRRGAAGGDREPQPLRRIQAAVGARGGAQLAPPALPDAPNNICAMCASASAAVAAYAAATATAASGADPRAPRRCRNRRGRPSSAASGRRRAPSATPSRRARC